MRPPVATVRSSPDKEERGGQRMTAARIIEAIGSLLWPLLVAVLLIRVLPHVPGVVADLRRAMRTRAFTVKVAGAELTAEALDVLSLRRGIHAVVTDLGRTEDGEFRTHAGQALLRQLKEAEHDQPVLVYTEAARAQLDRQDALDAG